MNAEALNEMADYLDRGEFGGKQFRMSYSDSCVLAHAARRKSWDDTIVCYGLSQISLEIFGIDAALKSDEYTFAFGGMWNDDPHAAADRLRYLARHGGAPDRSVWDSYRSARSAEYPAPKRQQFTIKLEPACA